MFKETSKRSLIFIPLTQGVFFLLRILRFAPSLVFKNWVIMCHFVVFFMFILLEVTSLLGSVIYSSIKLGKFQLLFLQIFFEPHFLLSSCVWLKHIPDYIKDLSGKLSSKAIGEEPHEFWGCQKPLCAM